MEPQPEKNMVAELQLGQDMVEKLVSVREPAEGFDLALEPAVGGLVQQWESALLLYWDLALWT